MTDFDLRPTCRQCASYRNARCTDPRRGFGLAQPIELAPVLASLKQNCPAYQSVRRNTK
jgi:hypothetical protein